jgi:hypothetical protein
MLAQATTAASYSLFLQNKKYSKRKVKKHIVTDSVIKRGAKVLSIVRIRIQLFRPRILSKAVLKILPRSPLRKLAASFERCCGHWMLSYLKNKNIGYNIAKRTELRILVQYPVPQTWPEYFEAQCKALSQSGITT